MIHNALFSLRSKGVQEGFFGLNLLFLIKIFNFYQKQQVQSDRFFLSLIIEQSFD